MRQRSAHGRIGLCHAGPLPLNLVRVAAAELQLQVVRTVAFPVLAVESRRHAAPDLHALHARNVAGLLQIDPVGLVQFWADQEAEVLMKSKIRKKTAEMFSKKAHYPLAHLNFAVFADQRGGQAQLALGGDFGQHLSEFLGRHGLHLQCAVETG